MSPGTVSDAATDAVTDAVTELLARFRRAGVLGAADVHVATTIARAGAETDPLVVLAAALCARAPRHGHVCIEPATIAATLMVGGDDEPDLTASQPDDDGHDPGNPDADAPVALPWPDPAAWADALRASANVRAPGDTEAPGTRRLPLVFDGTRCWLERYWAYERRVAAALRARAADASGCFPDNDATAAALDAAFAPPAPDPDAGAPGPDPGPDRQRAAAHLALTRRLTVIAGGPGTGKTRTIAHTLLAATALARAEGRDLRIGLATPTGKAADRMTKALAAAVAGADVGDDVRVALDGLAAVTLHRLLGGSPRGTFRHGPDDPLPHDLVVVDETSMVSLPLMAHLLAALRPGTGLVLVGDPDQLVSIEAGAVLGDIVDPVRIAQDPSHALRDCVVVLDKSYRFGGRDAIVAFADAVRRGAVDAAVAALRTPSDQLAWIDPADPTAVDALADGVAAVAAESVAAARAGNATAALEHSAHVKVLCGTRHGDLGSYRWTERIEARLGLIGTAGRWYVGRPVIVTRNDHLNRLFNGDTGIYVATPDGDPAVVFPAGADGTRRVATAQLAESETWWAMTVHKSQGSEFDEVVVSLPTTESPILTRELLYTGVTRAKEKVTIVATEAALRAAIGRPVQRATGLRAALSVPPPGA